MEFRKLFINFDKNIKNCRRNLKKKLENFMLKMETLENFPTECL